MRTIKKSALAAVPFLEDHRRRPERSDMSTSKGRATGQTLAFCLRSVPIRSEPRTRRGEASQDGGTLFAFLLDQTRQTEESRKACTFYRRSLTPGADAGSPKRTETATRPREQPKTEGKPIKVYFIYRHEKRASIGQEQGKNGPRRTQTACRASRSERKKE